MARKKVREFAKDLDGEQESKRDEKSVVRNTRSRSKSKVEVQESKPVEPHPEPVKEKDGKDGVQCPICSLQLLGDTFDINKHIDNCLAGNSNQDQVTYTTLFILVEEKKVC